MKVHTPGQLMPAFLLCSILILALILAAMGQDSQRPWKPYQSEFFRLERERLERSGMPGSTKEFDMGIRQVMVSGLDRVDRCTTCHLGGNQPEYVDAPQPLTSHPPIPGHTLEVFGCTICHRGNGAATYSESAHEGMLPRGFVHASCMACHELDSLPDIPGLRKGRAHFEAHGCLSCHQLDGVGERIGPPLDHVGERFSYEWFMKHFQDPASTAPGSGMPPVQLDPQGLEELTLYVMGLVQPVQDPYFSSKRVLPTPQAGKHLFHGRGCIGCHSLNGVGGQVGADVTSLGSRGTATWIRFVLQQPQAALPGSTMPHPDLRPDEIEALVAYILDLQSDSGSDAP